MSLLTGRAPSTGRIPPAGKQTNPRRSTLRSKPRSDLRRLSQVFDLALYWHRLCRVMPCLIGLLLNSSGGNGRGF